MTLTEEQIEWIVAEVVRRLAAAGVAADSPPKTDLKIIDRVVTLRTIEKQLAGVRRVVVPMRAVVTPAVRDELKARKVELVFEKT
jgi:hypothetical protein